MNHLASTTLALFDFAMEPGHIIAIAAITMPFVMIICVQVARVIGRTQQEKMRLTVMRAAIERGQPIPVEALRPTPDEDTDAAEIALKVHAQKTGSYAEAQLYSARNDIRAGLICVGVGAGLFLMFGGFDEMNFGFMHGLRWVGAIPGFVGVALFISGLIHRTPAANPSARDLPTPRN